VLCSLIVKKKKSLTIFNSDNVVMSHEKSKFSLTLFGKRHGVTGYVFLFGGTIVCWSSKTQNCVAKSTMEAKYISCSTAVSNAVWIGFFY
jgi:hypothetical protein